MEKRIKIHGGEIHIRLDEVEGEHTICVDGVEWVRTNRVNASMLYSLISILFEHYFSQDNIDLFSMVKDFYTLGRASERGERTMIDEKLSLVMDKIGEEMVGEVAENEDFKTLYSHYAELEDISFFDMAIDFYLLGKSKGRELGELGD